MTPRVSCVLEFVVDKTVPLNHTENKQTSYFNSSIFCALTFTDTSPYHDLFKCTDLLSVYSSKLVKFHDTRFMTGFQNFARVFCIT